MSAQEHPFSASNLPRLPRPSLLHPRHTPHHIPPARWALCLTLPPYPALPPRSPAVRLPISSSLCRTNPPTNRAAAQIRGIRTNLPFLENVLRHPEFLAGQATTFFIEKHARALFNYEGHGRCAGSV
jgi:hypothetical protein